MGSRGLCLLAAVGVLGACIGSFLNAVIYRLPRECLSIVRPRSLCPRCGGQIAWYDNLPVISWLLLRGACRRCRARIPVRYPLIEIGTSVAFVALALHVVGAGGLEDPAHAVRGWLYFFIHASILSTLIALTFIDIDHRILPDELTKGGLVVGLAFATFVPEIMPPHVLTRIEVAGKPIAAHVGQNIAGLLEGIAGAALGGGALWAIGRIGSRVTRKEAMGLGDVKLLAAIGAVTGIWCFLALMLASVLGAVIGLALRVLRGDRYVPFGPYLAAGALLTLHAGPAILEGWMGLFAHR